MKTLILAEKLSVTAGIAQALRPIATLWWNLCDVDDDGARIAAQQRLARA